MARSRNIKHGLYLNEELAELSIYARYLFPCLWCLADKEGRMEYRPRKIKAEAYPYDDVDIPALLVELHEKQFIFVYGHGTRAYIQVNHWGKHQNPHPKEKASELPAIDDPQSIVATIGNGEGHEKQFIFTAKHGEAAKPSDDAVEFNLIPDSNPSDSNPSDCLPVPMTNTEVMLRECMECNRAMLAGKYPHVDLDIELEEMVAKYRHQSIGADAFLLVSRWLKNLPAQKDVSPPAPDKFAVIMKGVR